ncbi:hypothetical protein B0T10DRAFT_114585 [Thelonectria olida]|uniref:Uncharacterized protein n=1 Tax=Thelonectria olida TaxID=1576542 RepID=A0A9P8WGQ2_9HYPO|nr:hypothetical protein B0T10DRAFT_114585 [Thelonectria olida]
MEALPLASSTSSRTLLPPGSPAGSPVPFRSSLSPEQVETLDLKLGHDREKRLQQIFQLVVCQSFSQSFVFHCKSSILPPKIASPTWTYLGSPIYGIKMKTATTSDVNARCFLGILDKKPVAPQCLTSPCSAGTSLEQLRWRTHTLFAFPLLAVCVCRLFPMALHWASVIRRRRE